MPFALTAVLAATLCTWKPAATGDPLHRFFSGAKVECRDAKAGKLATERVNVFVRDAERIGVDVALTDHIDEETLRAMLERARPAAQLKVHGLADGDALFAYVEDVAIPLVVDAGVARVPANTTFTLIATSAKGEITAVSAPVRAEDRETTLTKSALIGWIESRLPKTNAPKSTPVVLLDGKRKSDTKPLLIFRGISDGTHELTLRGDGWKSRTIAVDTNGLTVMNAPLVATPSRNLAVRWSLLNNPATLAPKQGDCDPKEPVKVSGPMTMTLLDCPGMQPNAWYMSVNRRNCTDAAKVTLSDDQRHGRVDLDDLASGPYLLRFSRNGLPDQWQSVVVPDDRDGDVQADVEYFRLFGTITRGGKPVRATIHVSGGEALSDADGKYEMTLIEKRVANLITVTACDTAEDYVHIADERPAVNTRVDIDIPQNVLKVDAVDADDAKPIAQAMVSFGMLMNGKEGDDGGAWYGGNFGKTDEHGHFSLQQTDTKHRVRVCASREDYEEKCAEDFRFEEQPEVAIRLALKKVELRHGRVRVQGPVDTGFILWHSRDGRYTETARVKEDGTFTFTKTHAPGEIVTFASSSHPLYVFFQPLVQSGQPFEFALPAAPVRNFEIALSESAQTEVTFYSLVIGDVPLPSAGLSAFAMRHGGIPHTLHRGGSAVLVHDILETGPISVRVISFPFFEANNLPDRDLALVAAAGSLPRFPVGNESRVVVNDH